MNENDALAEAHERVVEQSRQRAASEELREAEQRFPITTEQRRRRKAREEALERYYSECETLPETETGDRAVIHKDVIPVPAEQAERERGIETPSGVIVCPVVYY